jgi:hypothetical protein
MTPIALTTDLTLFILTSFALIIAGPWLADLSARRNHPHRMCVTVMPARKSLGRKSALPWAWGVAGMAQNARGH